MKYLRLLRLPDQYIQFAAGIAAGMLLGSREPRILWWAVATIFLAIPAYMVNELVDRKDTDRYSWNPIHKKLQSDTYSIPIVGALFALSTAVGLLMSVLLGYEWFGDVRHRHTVLASSCPFEGQVWARYRGTTIFFVDRAVSGTGVGETVDGNNTFVCYNFELDHIRRRFSVSIG